MSDRPGYTGVLLNSSPVEFKACKTVGQKIIFKRRVMVIRLATNHISRTKSQEGKDSAQAPCQHRWKWERC